MNDTAESLLQVQPLQPGACFVGIKALRAAVGKEFARMGRSFVASRSSGSRQKMYNCSGHSSGCQALVRAYKPAKSDEWKVHKVHSDHTGCSGGSTPGRSAALGDIARRALNDNPDLQGIGLKRKIERDTGIKVKHRTATRLKNAARKDAHTAVTESYRQLPSFCKNLQENCPGTVAEVQKHGDGTFKRVGIMLGRAAHVCRESPLKVICVDAGHLKGEWKGVMLVVTCKDANNTLVHLATVICDKENSDNYAWLYELMKKNSEMRAVLNSNKTTIFTDGHQSHGPAINAHASEVVWRLCLRHLIGKLPQQVGQTVNGWIFHAARAPSAPKFREIMEKEVKPSKPKAYEGLMATDLKKWTHHAGPPDTVIGDQTTSNPVEQNMSMIGAEARKLPPGGLILEILDKTARKMAERALLQQGTSRKLTPFAAKAFEGQRNKSSDLNASPTGNGNFTVRQQGSNYGNRVRLVYGEDGTITTMSCTCRYPARWLIPCCDVIAVGRFLEKSDDVMNLIDNSYKMDTYRSVYDDPRFEVQLPMPEELTEDKTIFPPRPVQGQAGRPPKGRQQTKRIPSVGEKNASSSFNVRLSPSSGTTPNSANVSQGGPVLSQGGIGGGLSQGAPVLSQGGRRGGLSQEALAPSQGGGVGGLSQGTPTPSQGGGVCDLSQGAPAPSQTESGVHSGTISIDD